jgi:DNA-binding winged helix-turn-helix (wHTH) protein
MTIDTHIRRLRAKLGNYAQRLETVRAEGYRFNPVLQPSPVAAEEERADSKEG